MAVEQALDRYLMYSTTPLHGLLKSTEGQEPIYLHLLNRQSDSVRCNDWWTSPMQRRTSTYCRELVFNFFLEKITFPLVIYFASRKTTDIRETKTKKTQSYNKNCGSYELLSNERYELTTLRAVESNEATVRTTEICVIFK